MTDGELARALAPATGRLWLAWAGCFGAGFSDVAGPRRVSTYASAENALSYESPGLGHSFLAEYMVRRAALTVGRTSVEGMYRWAVKHMRGRIRRFRPLLDDRVPGDLVLAARRHREPPPSPRPEEGTCLPLLGCRESSSR